MGNYLYILVILYNLNLLLNTYIEVMIKLITIFNYKNTTQYNNVLAFYDIISYQYFSNKSVLNLLIKIS
jgi:hypothetical protein